MKTGLRWKHLFDIFTVFLGVMLAFLVNSWKEEHANQRLRQQYWKNFLEEVTENTSRLDSTFTILDARLNRMGDHIQSLEAGNLPKDSLQAMLQILTRLNLVAFQTATYEAIKSSGAWHLFDPRSQLLTVIRYYQQIEAAQTVQDFLTTYFNQHTIPFLQKHINFLSLNGDTGILNNPEFQNIYLVNYSLRNQLKEQYQKLRNISRTILAEHPSKPKGEQNP